MVIVAATLVPDWYRGVVEYMPVLFVACFLRLTSAERKKRTLNYALAHPNISGRERGRGHHRGVEFFFVFFLWSWGATNQSTHELTPISIPSSCVTRCRITLSARWKIKFSDGTSLLYRGDVVQDAEGTALTVDATGAAAKGGAAFARPDAHIRGEVLRPVTNIQGSLSEKKIGEFEADLIELPSDSDTL